VDIAHAHVPRKERCVARIIGAMEGVLVVAVAQCKGHCAEIWGGGVGGFKVYGGRFEVGCGSKIALGGWVGGVQECSDSDVAEATLGEE